MSLTWEEYQAAYKIASEEIKVVLDSDQLAQACDKIINDHQLSETTYTLIIGILSRIILGVIDPNNGADTIVKLLEEPTISESAKVAIAHSIIDSALEIKKQADELSASATSTSSFSSEIIQTEAALEHLSSVRTMARDMHHLENQAPHEPNTYSSTQDNNLQPKQ